MDEESSAQKQLDSSLTGSATEHILFCSLKLLHAQEESLSSGLWGGCGS